MAKKLNQNFANVVNILSDGNYHDGTSIGAKLQMTRSAIWKTIKKLESFKVKVNSVKRKGYALLEPLILLDANKIKNKLTNNNIIINVFESLDSTNDYLKSVKQDKKIIICAAEHQTQGKGRLNREWYSPFGKNIYLSCSYHFQKDVSELAGLSMVTSLAIIKTLQEEGIKDHLAAKWPNDIIYANKKLSGSLIEIQAETHGHSHAIIGMGINVNMLDADHSISQAWTSMQQILGKYSDRNDICARLINNLVDYLHRFEKESFATFVEEWVRTDCLTHQLITVSNVHDKVTGKVMGINEQGHLLLKLESGVIRAFSSGDTSIVKI